MHIHDHRKCTSSLSLWVGPFVPIAQSLGISLVEQLGDRHGLGPPKLSLCTGRSGMREVSNPNLVETFIVFNYKNWE